MDETETSHDPEREEIRSELSKMTFEQLQKLKQKLGQKVYKEAMYGVKSVKETQFKRANKNRPREVSSKIKPEIKKKPKQERILDPRFDRLCGTFNEKHFQNTYGFLSEIKKREKAELLRNLKSEKDPEKAKKIKYLLQRMKNQELEQQKKLKMQEKMEKEKEEQIQAYNSGKKPYFRTKYERKIVDLVDKYSELKKSGKVQKYIEKKMKKQKIKEKHKRYFDVNIDEMNNN